MPQLRISSYGNGPAPPPALRRLQIAALPLQLFFIGVQVAVIRWNRSAARE
jgi:hypothetical protein